MKVESFEIKFNHDADDARKAMGLSVEEWKKVESFLSEIILKEYFNKKRL